MKRIPVVTCILVGCLFLVNAYGEDGPKEGGDRAGTSGRERLAGTPMARAEARPAAKASFAGSVVAVDMGAATFSLKEKGNVIGFDASNPVLAGYRTLADMRIGDMVRVSYTATGIEVTNLGGRRGRAARKEGGAQTQTPRVQVTGKPTKGVKKLLRRAKIGDGECFDDVDLKKNGKITPMELSIVIKDLTMEQFRKYDKKHRGYLDKGEFLDAVRDYHSGKEE
jgi:hypothetical protein